MRSAHATRLAAQLVEGDGTTVVLVPTAARAAQDGVTYYEWQARCAETVVGVEDAVAELRRRGYALRVERRPGHEIHEDVETVIVVEVVRLPHGAAA